MSTKIRIEEYRTAILVNHLVYLKGTYKWNYLMAQSRRLLHDSAMVFKTYSRIPAGIQDTECHRSSRPFISLPQQSLILGVKYQRLNYRKISETAASALGFFAFCLALLLSVKRNL